MKTIWKYVISEVGTVTTHKMPANAEIVFVGVQMNSICFWSIVQPEVEIVKRQFYVSATGEKLESDKFNYIGTVQTGFYVWHLWELTT